MSTTSDDQVLAELERSLLTHPRLPSWAPALVGVMAVALGSLVWLLGGGVVLGVLVAAAGYLVGMPLWSAAVENRRSAVDRFVTGVVWMAFGVAMVPLVWLLWTVVKNGAPAINAEFLTFSMRGVIGDEHRTADAGQCEHGDSGRHAHSGRGGDHAAVEHQAEARHGRDDDQQPGDEAPRNVLVVREGRDEPDCSPDREGEHRRDGQGEHGRTIHAGHPNPGGIGWLGKVSLTNLT